jgi:hypothetical protein
MHTPTQDKVVLIHFAASNCTNTTTQHVIDVYHAKYGQQKQFTVEPVEYDDPRINWESLPSLAERIGRIV